MGKKNSDENYVLDLCDNILRIKSSRQHTFDFLRGNAGKKRKGRKLPVDAYYPKLKLVIEYKEKQHFEKVELFDKPDKMTISGVHRGKQRKLYDERRKVVLPKQGIEIIEIEYRDFKINNQKKLIRNDSQVRIILKNKFLKRLL